eukprot:7924310-Pyramimonas_sp.AAC.1
MQRCTIGHHPFTALVGLSMQVIKQSESCQENSLARLALTIAANIHTHDIPHAVLDTHVR